MQLSRRGFLTGVSGACMAATSPATLLKALLPPIPTAAEASESYSWLVAHIHEGVYDMKGILPHEIVKCANVISDYLAHHGADNPVKDHLAAVRSLGNEYIDCGWDSEASEIAGKLMTSLNRVCGFLKESPPLDKFMEMRATAYQARNNYFTNLAAQNVVAVNQEKNTVRTLTAIMPEEESILSAAVRRAIVSTVSAMAEDKSPEKEKEPLQALPQNDHVLMISSP